MNILRLWRARATEEFDFQLFDVGDYARAVEQKVYSENISKVLYPNDVTPQGKELRLKQQYFFVACSLRDIIRRFRLRNDDWDQFPEKVAIQLNDTHPGGGHSRTDADPDGRACTAIGTGPGRSRSDVRLHLPHAAARSAGEMAGRPVREPAAPAPGDHLRDQSPLPGRSARAVSRRRGPCRPACRSSRKGRSGRCGWPTWPPSAASPSTAWPNCNRDCSGSGRCAISPRCGRSEFQNKTNGVTPRRFMRLANPAAVRADHVQDRRRLAQRS